MSYGFEAVCFCGDHIPYNVKLGEVYVAQCLGCNISFETTLKTHCADCGIDLDTSVGRGQWDSTINICDNCSKKRDKVLEDKNEKNT